VTEKQIEEWLDLWKGVGKGLVREKWTEEGIAAE
jgi:hypothetical protein